MNDNMDGQRAMSVTEAVDRRRSTRGFLDREVPIDLVRDILGRALRSPSGGNLQPWRIYALTGQPLTELIDDVLAKLPTRGFGGDGDLEYPVYPADLADPYAARRSRAGEDLYAALGIPREDKDRRRQQFVHNFRFFGAPAGLFFYIDRAMGAAQWSDLGMVMQTVMLLATERGLATCAQEAWSIWHKTVRAHVGAPAELMLFSGMALGFADTQHPTGSIRTDRAALDDVVSLRGWA